MSAQKNDYKHGYPNNSSNNHRYNDDRRHRDKQERDRDEPRHFNSSRAHDRGRSRSRSYSYDQHKNYSRVHNEARFERISKAYAREEHASNQYYAGPNANESAKARGDDDRRSDYTKPPLRQPPQHQADEAPKAGAQLEAPRPEPEAAYVPRSAADQEKIQKNLLAFLEINDDDYLDELEVDEVEVEPQPEKVQKTEEPAPLPAQAQDPPSQNAVIMTSASKKSAHHHRRAIEDDDGDDDNQEIVQSQQKSVKAEEKKQSQKTEENDQIDAKSQHSSSDSFDKESQNSANKRKMKQLEKLKNELLRRKQISAKNGGAQMSIDQQAQYLKDRSQEEMQTIQAEKAKRAAEREIREARSRAVRERRQQEAAPAAKQAPARKKAAPKKVLSKPEKENDVGPPKESQKKEAKPKTIIPRQTPAKRPAVVKEATKKSDLDFKNHSFLVEEFSVRFNQVLAPYPPANYDYSSALLAQSLNRVTSEQFQKLKHYNPEEAKAVAESPSKKGGSKKSLSAPKDSALDALKDLLKPGMTLVYELNEYPGIFRDKSGTNYDLRPNDDKIVRPSLKTFTEMATNKLQRLLLEAYKKQLEELEKPDHEQYDKGYEEECLIPSLKRKISALGKIVTV